MALNHRRTRRFATRSCNPVARGPPSSRAQLSLHTVVGVTLERNMRILFRHPRVERVVKKYIRQERTDNPALRCSFLAADNLPVFAYSRRFEPPFDVD
jgi:hypothetical protein